jgi:hypothetical protein
MTEFELDLCIPMKYPYVEVCATVVKIMNGKSLMTEHGKLYATG